MVKAVIGIGNISFNAVHYTLGAESKCMNLHGHTYRLIIEVEGDVNPDTGMVIDFTILKKTVVDVINEYDHKIIVPKKDLDKIELKGPFRKDIKVVDYPFATAEYLAIDIAKKVYEKLKLPVKLKLYEGLNNYVIVKIS